MDKPDHKTAVQTHSARVALSERSLPKKQALIKLVPVPPDMGVFSGKISQKQQILDQPIFLRIMVVASLDGRVVRRFTPTLCTDLAAKGVF